MFRYKGITPDYYGFRDEDDGVLVAVEAAAEARQRAAAVSAWERARDEKRRRAEEEGKSVVESACDSEGDDVGAELESAALSASLRSHVPVPSQESLVAVILERKKAALLAKYVLE